MSQIECSDYGLLSWNLNIRYIYIHIKESICLGSKARGTAKRKWTPNKRDWRAHYIGFRRWGLMKTIYIVKPIAVFLLKGSVHQPSVYSLPPLPGTEPVTEADYLLPGESAAFVFLDYE